MLLAHTLLLLCVYCNLLQTVCTQSYCNTNASEPVSIPIAALFPKTGWWPGGRALHIAAQMALEDVNARPDVLPGYRLDMVWNDTEVGTHIYLVLIKYYRTQFHKQT